MASAVMNAIKEEVAATASVASVPCRSALPVSSAVASAGRHSAPSTSARVAANHAGTEAAGLLARTIRGEAMSAIRTQPVLDNLTAGATENPMLSSVLGRTTNAETNALQNVLPELREQISQAAQQGFEELVGDQVPRAEPSWGVVETIQQLEEIATTR